MDAEVPAAAARTEEPNPIDETREANGITVHFVDADTLLGPRRPRRAAEDGHVPGAPPPLVAKAPGVEAYHVDVDDLLGAKYDVSVPVRLPDWVTTDDVPVLSDSADDADGSGREADDWVLSEAEEGGEADFDGGAGALGGGTSSPSVKHPGFQGTGRGRTRGSGLDVRASMHQILVILFCRQIEASLGLREAGDSRSEHLLSGCTTSVRQQRRLYSHITDAVLSTKAWTLRRSGSVGALFKFKDKGARDNQARDSNLAVEIFLSDADELGVACSRSEEDCVVDGCSQKAVVLGALQEVVACTGMDLTGVLGLLCEDLRVSALNQGIAVMYGPNLCVVRREGGSWPFAVVRRKNKGIWMCHACHQGPGSCTHAQAAADAGRNEQSEASDDEDLINNLGRGRQSKRSNTVYSTQPRPLVPSTQALAGHAAVVRAAETGATVFLPAPYLCSSCGHGRSHAFSVFSRAGTVEFGQASVRTSVQSWWCGRCRRFCVTDGIDQGLIICSQFTAYTEYFLFECTINLCRNASSLTSTFNLRSAFHQLLREHLYPHTHPNLRSLPLFRFAALLYIYLVLDDLPLAVSTCAVCTRPDGSLQFICFDGLQVGFKVRYQTPFSSISIKLSPIHRASIQALMVSDTAVGRALGSILSSATTAHDAIAGPIKTVTAIRGHLIALAVLAGDVVIPGERNNLSGTMPHAQGVSRSRGYDPKMDGGVHPALLDFIREIFRCGRAARKVARTVVEASASLKAKVPAVILDRAKRVIQAEDADEGTESDVSGDGTDDAAMDGELVRQRHLPGYARDVADPVLADAGGVAGEERRGGALLRPKPAIAVTAGSGERLVDFVRAVVVDPVVVWAPGGDWTAIGAVVSALAAEPFRRAKLQRAVRSAAVKELRLLHGALVSLYPALCTQPRVRVVMINLLTAVCATHERYREFVDQNALDELPRDERNEIVMATREEMAAAPNATFHPAEFTAAYFSGDVSWDTFLATYGERAVGMRDYLLSGQWAPSFPPVRALPNFLAVSTSGEDAPECSHLMGLANRWTGGTFTGSCTCTHPKTIGVVVLEGSESQRMPIEFVTQRMPRFPDRVFYDFACASLKMALCRLPFIALFLAFLVDRFHWLKNHVWCSKAMNPDSFRSLDAQNTSASEERNAASRRLQNFLRLVKQRNFILFTVYQQAVGNVIAMHRDALDETDSTVGADDWPLWYKKKFVDVADGGDNVGEAAADGADAGLGEEAADGAYMTAGEEQAHGADTAAGDEPSHSADAVVGEEAADGGDAAVGQAAAITRTAMREEAADRSDAAVGEEAADRPGAAVAEEAADRPGAAVAEEAADPPGAAVAEEAAITRTTTWEEAAITRTTTAEEPADSTDTAVWKEAADGADAAAAEEPADGGDTAAGDEASDGTDRAVGGEVVDGADASAGDVVAGGPMNLMTTREEAAFTCTTTGE